MILWVRLHWGGLFLLHLCYLGTWAGTPGAARKAGPLSPQGLSSPGRLGGQLRLFLWVPVSKKVRGKVVVPHWTWAQKPHTITSAVICRSEQVTRPLPTQGVEKSTPKHSSSFSVSHSRNPQIHCFMKGQLGIKSSVSKIIIFPWPYSTSYYLISACELTKCFQCFIYPHDKLLKCVISCFQIED